MNKIQNKREINRIELKARCFLLLCVVFWLSTFNLLYFFDNRELKLKCARVCVCVVCVCLFAWCLCPNVGRVCVCVYLCGSGRRAYASNVLFNCFLSVFASLCFTFFSLLLSLIHNLVIFFLVIYNIKTK